MCRLDLRHGEAADFKDWVAVDLVLTNAYDLAFVASAMAHNKPMVIHVMPQSLGFYYFHRQLLFAGSLFEGQGPPGQALFLYQLELPPFSLEEFRATEEGWWPLDMAVKLLAHYGRPGITVIDPFMGRGTVGRACCSLDMHFIGIDRDAARVELARQYISGGGDVGTFG